MRSHDIHTRRSGYNFAGFVVVLYCLLLLYDGAIRKWVLPQFETYVFVLKDIVLAAGLGYLLLAGRRPASVKIPGIIVPWLVLYFLWIVLSSFNPWLPNWLVALWGLKTYSLTAIALFTLIPAVFQDTNSVLRSLVRWFPLVVVPICLLGIVQVFSPVDSIVNKQVRDDAEAVAAFGSANLIRVSGTFSYLAGMASFIQAATLLGFALFICGARNARFLISFGVILASMPITGSRGVVAVVVAGAAVMLVVAFAAGLVSVGRALRITVVGAALAVTSLFLLTDVWTALEERSQSSIGDASRYITAFTNAFDFFEFAGLAGFGTGAANLGAPALTPGVVPFSWIPGQVEFEEESGRTVLELGILGWLISLCLRVALVVWAFSLAVRGRSLTTRAVGTMSVPVTLVSLHVGIGVFSSPVWSFYVWLCVTLCAMVEYEERRIEGSAKRDDVR